MPRIAAGLAVAGLIAIRSAAAATLFFDATPTTTSTCPMPCYEIRMFYEDSSRKLPLQALRFDAAILGANVPVLPVPPATNFNTGSGNGFERTTFAVQPWSLRSVVGGSSDPEYDVWVADEADTPLTIDAVAARFADGCGGASCTAIESGLRADRLYLGRFNVTPNGGVVAIQLGTITGEGAGAVDPVEGVARFSNAVFKIEGFQSTVRTLPRAVHRRQRRSPLAEQRTLPSDAPVPERMHKATTVELSEGSAPGYRASAMSDCLQLNVPGLHVDQSNDEVCIDLAQEAASPPWPLCGPDGSSCVVTEYELDLNRDPDKQEVRRLESREMDCDLHVQRPPLPERIALLELVNCVPTSFGPMCESDTVPAGTPCHMPTRHDVSAPNAPECGVGGKCMAQPGVSCLVELPLGEAGLQVSPFDLNFDPPAPNSVVLGSSGQAATQSGRGGGSMCSSLDLRCKQVMGHRYLLPESRGGDGTKTYLRWFGEAGAPPEADWIFAAGRGSDFYSQRAYGRRAHCSRAVHFAPFRP